MDFTIPKEITDLLVRIDDVHRARRSCRCRSRTTMTASSIIAANGRAPISSMAGCRARSGKTLLREMRVRADKAGFLRLALPEEYRRQEYRQSRDGDHPRASRGEGAGPAQRSAERNLRRRQFPAGADDARFRHGGAEEDLSARHAGRHGAPRLRSHRTEARLRRDLDGNARGEGRQWLAHQWREDVEHRRARRDARHGVLPHLAARTATRAGSPA